MKIKGSTFISLNLSNINNYDENSKHKQLFGTHCRLTKLSHRKMSFLKSQFKSLLHSYLQK